MVETASVDDYPVLTAVGAEEGCGAHDNSCKVTVPTSLINIV